MSDRPLTSRYCKACFSIFDIGLEDYYDTRAGEWQRWMRYHCRTETIPCPTATPGQNPVQRAKEFLQWAREKRVNIPMPLREGETPPARATKRAKVADFARAFGED